MKKSHLFFVCLVGLLAKVAYANQPYSEAQLINLIQEDAKQLQLTPKSKKIVGERVDFSLPKSMHLAYLAGNEKSQFLAEYIHKKENINHWKSEFIAQQRSKVPLDILTALTIAELEQACPSPYLYTDVQQLKNDPSRIVLSYFCKLSQNNAPLGEGAVMTLLQGNDYTFKFWHSWRPQSEQDFVEFTNVKAETGSTEKINLGIKPEKYLELVNQGFSVSLCNPQAKKPCRFMK